MDIQKLIDSYITWLKEGFTFEKIGEFYEITTPYFDNFNDCLQIYVKQEGNEILFSDDGVTLNNLKSHGLQIKSGKKNELERSLYPFGVKLVDNELTIKATEEDFAFKKHQFLQAIMHINDIYGTYKPSQRTNFIDDIQSFFNQNEIYCSDNVQFTGKSGFSHNYDFLFSKSKNHPERLCRTLNNPTKQNAMGILFSWEDTKAARNNNSELIIFLNDQNNIGSGVEDALQNYNANIIFWSKRSNKKNLELLSA